jgi:uncharacterized delta-60 repeat protein
VSLIGLNDDGTLDSGFGTAGVVTTNLGGNESVWDLALQPDGRIVVVGGGGGNHLLVARYLADGGADTSFSGDGNLVLSRSSFEILYAVDIAPDGRIVAAGYGTNATEDLALLRLSADGTPDTRLATGSSSLGGAVSYTENGPPVVIDSSVRVFDAELSAADSFDGATLTLARSGGASSQDVFSATGNLAALTGGQGLVLGGVTVGTVVANAGGTLSLSFNASATQARINEVLSSIAYANSLRRAARQRAARLGLQRRQQWRPGQRRGARRQRQLDGQHHRVERRAGDHLCRGQRQLPGKRRSSHRRARRHGVRRGLHQLRRRPAGGVFLGQRPARGPHRHQQPGQAPGRSG